MPFMILFEAVPNAGREDEYFEISKGLFEILEQQPGFISIDRARSVLSEGKLLSVSFWESEAAIEGWLNHPLQREAQRRGKEGIVRSMRIARMEGLYERGVPGGEVPVWPFAGPAAPPPW